MKRSITGRLVLFLLLLAGLAVLTAASASAWAAAALALAVLVPVVSFGLNFYIRKHISASLTLPVSAGKNRLVCGRLAVRSTAFLPVLRYFCRIRVHNDLTGEQSFLELSGGVGAGRETVHEFTLSAGFCGRISLSIGEFFLLDFFGLLPLRALVSAGARTTVLPDLFPTEVLVTSHAAYSDEGTVSSRGEDRSEVFQFREYQPGDDVRQIHWKLSSKLDQLVLKEAGCPENRSLLLFWDKRGEAAPAQLDALAEAVASVCSALVQEGIRFTLCWTEQDELLSREVADENALLEVIPALMRTVGSAACRAADPAGYSRTLWFGTVPEEELLGSGRIHFILCTDSGADADGMTVFSPHNTMEKLQRLEV